MESKEQMKKVHKALPEFKLKNLENAINSKKSKKIQGNIEKDDEFMRDIFAIAQHTRTTNKEIFTKRAQLTQEQYQMIQTIGDVHYQSNIFNQTSLKEDQNISKDIKCPCGCNRGHGEPLPFCIDEEDQTYFGQGIILFFYYTKRIILVVLSIIVIYGIYALVTNFVIGNYSSDCSSPGPLPFLCQFKIQTSVEAKTGRSDLMIGQLVLGLAICIIWSISLRLIRAKGRRKMQQIDDKLDSSSDYCITLENLPQGQYSEVDIIRYLSQKWRSLKQHNKSQLKIRTVQIIYKMGQIRQKIAQINNLADQLVSYLEVPEEQDATFISEENKDKEFKIKQQFVQKYQQDKDQIIRLYNELKDFRKKFFTDEKFRRERTSEFALVELSSSSQKNRLLDEFGTFRMTVTKQLIAKIKECCKSEKEEEQLVFKGRNIKMIRAPQPSDIFWQHCEDPISKLTVLLVWLVNIALVGCSLGVLILINYIKSLYPQISGLSVVGIIALNLFNRVIWNVLQKVVLKEENYTKTDNIISVMNKSYVAQGINIIIVPMVVTVGINGKLDGADGLMGQIHDYQLLSLLFMILFNLINVPHRLVRFIECVKCLRRAAIKYYCRVTGQLDTLDEMKDAITFLYDPPIIPVAGFYVYITTIMSQAAFYCHLSPMILFYLLLNMLLFYLINRYLLLRMSKIPDLIDYLVFETCVGFALNFSLLYGIGSIIFLNLRGDAPNFGYYVPSILCIIVWFLSVQSPFGLCRCIISVFMNSGKTQVQEESKEGEKRKFDVKISQCEIIQNSPEDEDSEQQICTRKQNYYGGNSTMALFNLESQLREGQGPYHNKNKEFCQRFRLNVKYKRSRDQMF